MHYMQLDETHIKCLMAQVLPDKHKTDIEPKCMGKNGNHTRPAEKKVAIRDPCCNDKTLKVDNVIGEQ